LLEFNFYVYLFNFCFAMMYLSSLRPREMRLNSLRGFLSVFVVLCAALFVSGLTPAKAQILDPTFTFAGPPDGFNAEVTDVIQIGTQLIVVGNFTIYRGTPINRVARINNDGTLDGTFTPPNNTVINGQVNSVAVDGAGFLYIGGQFNNGTQDYVMRLQANGALDAGFATTAIDAAVRSVIAIGTDVVAVGDYTAPFNRVARLNNTGALVAGFNPGAGFTGGNFASAVVLDGTHLIIGGDFSSYNGNTVGRIVRIDAATAAIDATFRTNSGGATGFNGDVLTLELVGNNVLVGGNFTSFNGVGRGRIARVRAGGSGATRGQNDGTFATGAGFDAAVNSISVDAAGRIIAGGGFLNYAGTARNNIARLQNNGNIDLLFNPGTGFNNTVNKVLNQADGKLVVGGRFTTYNTTSSRGRIARFAYASSAYVIGRTFYEATANDGSSNTELTVELGPAAPTAPLDLEEWTGAVANGADFTQGVHYNVTGVPAGMTMAIRKISNKIATLRLTGNAAAHANINDVIDGVTVTWLNAALLGNNAAGVENLNTATTHYSVDFRDPANALYSGTTFDEAAANNGTVPTVRTITLANTVWNEAIATGANLTAGVHYNIGGGPIPAGLTLVVTKTGALTATVALTGTAAPHTAAQNVAFQLNFTNAAVQTGQPAAGVTGLNGENLNVNFLNPGTAAYSGTTFPEVAANNGAVTQTRTITLTGEEWLNSVLDGTPLTPVTHYTVANVPAGLTAVVTKISNAVATISFTGNATAHAAANSVANVQFTFNGAAIQSGSIAGGLNGVNHAVNFIDPGSAVYSGAVFPESAANDGSITQTRTITLTDELWTDAVAIAANFTAGVHYTIANVPAGLTAVLTKTSANVATISFTGNATLNAPIHNVPDVQFTFLPAILQSGSIPGVTGLNGQNLSIEYINAGSAAFSGLTFPEAPSNNGAVTQTRTITLTNEQWTGLVANGAPLTAGVHYTVANVPAGLTAVVTKTSAGVATISFIGTATVHTTADDVANVQFTFLNAALQSGDVAGVTGLNGQNLEINYMNPGSGAFGGTVFAEAGANNGSITATNTITLTNEQWRAAVGVGTPLVAGVDYNVMNVPPGLTMVITKTSANVATISFTGNATNHMAANSVNNVQITFLPGAVISGNLTGLNGQDLTINFDDPAPGSAAYSGTVFPEAPINNGTVTQTRTITLTGDTWTAGVAIGGTLTDGVHYTVANVPPGLTAVLTKTAANVATISFTGAATAHAAANSVNNVEFTFTNAAVNSNNAAGTAGLNGQLLQINFNNPFSAAYSGTSFDESIANDGSIANSRTITLTGDTWTAGVAIGGALLAGVHYNAANIPPGLTPVLLKTSPTQVTVLLTGNAAPHLAANSVANAQFTFLDAAVQGGSAAAVAGLNGQNLSVNFIDVPPTGSAVYSGLVFNEAPANNGSITETQTVTLTGETWTAGVAIGAAFTDGIHYNVANVPAGLTMVITKTSNNVATISYTGNAAAHAAVNSVTDVQPTFLNASITGGVAAAITGLNGQNLSINFVNSPPANAVYSGLIFNESTANNGTVPDTQTITLTNDTWIAAVATGATFTTGAHFTVANVPAGLLIVLTKISDTQARISFMGSAAAHTAANNVGNVQITFQNAALTGNNAPAVAGLNGQNLSINYITGVATFASGISLTGNPSGSVTGSLPVNLDGDTFSGLIPDGTVLTEGIHYTLTGVPPGLTPVVTKISPTQVSITFTGAANPVPQGPVNGVQVTFLGATLTSGNPGAILGLNGQNLGLNFPTPVVTPPVLTINNFSPQGGPRGTLVRIGGSGFTGATAVRFGRFPAQSFTVLSDNFIEAVLDTTDGATIEVVSPLGSIQAIGFTYQEHPPAVTAVTGISPARFGFGTEVILTGSNFTGATEVLVGGVPVQSFVVESDGRIRAIVGGVPVSDVVQVFTNAPRTVSAPTSFSGLGAEYLRGQPPVLISVSPNPIVSSGESVPLTLRGFNFSPNARFFAVDGNAPPTQLDVINVNSTQATVVFPPQLRYPGVRRITVVNPDNQSASGNLEITPGPAPMISISPAVSTMATARPFTVRVTGSGIFPTSIFTLDGEPLTNIRVLSPTEALVEIPGFMNDRPRVADLRMTNTDRQSASVPVTIIRRPPPYIATVESTPINGSWQLTLRGREFQPNAEVTLFGQRLGILAAAGDSLVIALAPATFNIPSGSTASIILTNPDGQSYGVNLPQYMFDGRGGITTGVVPNGLDQPVMRDLRISIPQVLATSATGRPFTALLTGTGFLPSTLVSLDGSPVQMTRYISPMQMLIEIPAPLNAPRVGTLRLQNPDGQVASIPARFDNTPLPYISMVTNIPTPAGMQVVVYGGNFGPSPAVTVQGLPLRVVGNNDSVVVGFLQEPPAGFDCRTPSPCALTNILNGAQAGIDIKAGDLCGPCGGVNTQSRPVGVTTVGAPKTIAQTSSQTQASAGDSWFVQNAVASRELFGKARVFPNPASQTLFIEGIVAPQNETVRVRIIDAKGLALKELSGNERSFNISSFASGAYYVEFSTESGKRWITNFVIQR
jgi:hypothetical protein